jgi:Peptidase A4 family
LAHFFPRNSFRIARKNLIEVGFLPHDLILFKMKLNEFTLGILSIGIGVLLIFGSSVSYAATTNSGIVTGFSAPPASPAISKETFYNWAGYAVSTTAASPVTRAQGSWVEPSATCNTKVTSAQGVVFWVGIDGLTSGTVEQAGTFAYCTGSSTPTYYAWYEFYPAQDIITVSSMTVSPGDVFQGTIVGTTDTSFTVTLKDVTTGKSFSETNPGGFSGARTSAECIAETPEGSGGFFVIPDFGTAQYGKAYTSVKNTCTATINGTTQGLGKFGSNSYELTACNYSSCTTTLMQPSSITSGKTSFEVTWENAGP